MAIIYKARRKVPVFDGEFRLRELVPFVGAIVNGAVGGCIACLQHARTRRETVLAYAAAYALTGAFGGLMAMAGVSIFMPKVITGWASLFIVSGLSGIIVSSALAAGNLSMRFILAKLGFEIVIDIKKTDNKDEP